MRDLIGRVNLTKIDAWGLKAEFEKGLDKIDALTPAELEKPNPKIAMDEKLPVGEPKAFVTLPPPPIATPEMIVLEAWRNLEGTMRRIIDKAPPRHPGSLQTPPLRFEAAAEELG